MSDLAEVSWEYAIDSRETAAITWRVSILGAVIWLLGAGAILSIMPHKHPGAVIGLFVPAVLLLMLPALQPVTVTAMHVRFTAAGFAVSGAITQSIAIFHYSRVWRRELFVPWQRVRWWRVVEVVQSGHATYRLTLPLRNPLEVMSLPVPDELAVRAAKEYLQKVLPSARGRTEKTVQPSGTSFVALLVLAAIWSGIVAMFIYTGLLPSKYSEWKWLVLMFLIGPGLLWGPWVVFRGCQPAVIWFCVAVLANVLTNFCAFLVAEAARYLPYLRDGNIR